MKIENREFIPIILGNDINTYSVARAFYEEYKVKSIVLGKYRSGPSNNSKIIDFYADENMDIQEDFLKIIDSFSDEFHDKKIILLACGDSYAELIIKNKNNFKDNVIAPYIDEPLMNNLIKKSSFYEMCEKHGLDYPKTIIHDKTMDIDFKLPFEFPIIIKPSNSISYWENPFDSQKKVYKLYDQKSLKEVLKDIYLAGYDDSLIIQEFIPGEDTNLRIMITFSGRDKKVKLMALAQVMMEERTPHGIGNSAMQVNEYNEKLSIILKDFLENIGYEGYSTFDIKYDYRDDKYKVLEVNLRQGRSNFFVTGAGYNLARYVVDDYVYGKETGFTIAKAENLWTVVPISIGYKYVKDKTHVAKIKQLASEGRFVNPLFLKGDNSIKRLMFLFKNSLSQHIKFKKYYNQM